MGLTMRNYKRAQRTILNDQRLNQHALHIFKPPLTRKYYRGPITEMAAERQIMSDVHDHRNQSLIALNTRSYPARDVHLQLRATIYNGYRMRICFFVKHRKRRKIIGYNLAHTFQRHFINIGRRQNIIQLPTRFIKTTQFITRPLNTAKHPLVLNRTQYIRRSLLNDLFLLRPKTLRSTHVIHTQNTTQMPVLDYRNTKKRRHFLRFTIIRKPTKPSPNITQIHKLTTTRNRPDHAPRRLNFVLNYRIAIANKLLDPQLFIANIKPQQNTRITAQRRLQ